MIPAVAGDRKKMKQTNIHCHVETAIAVVGGKWKPWILWHLYDGVRRYGELRRLTPGITGKMLTQHLRELERDGVVERKVYDQKVPKVEYSFTKYGETMRPLLKELCQWGGKHAEHLAAESGAKAAPRKNPKARKKS
jgi:DNA-binding HxlR family transcriptional regulator